MNKVIHRETNAWGRTSTIIIAGGFAFVMVTVSDDNKDVAIIHDLVVHESRRRKGLGDKLLNEALNEAMYAIERNANAIIRLSVEPGSWMEGGYSSRGFAQEGVTTFRGQQIMVMEKDNTQ